MKRNKQALSLLCVLALLVSMLSVIPVMTAGAATENLVTNGDFESGIWDSLNGDAHNQSSTAHSGNYSMEAIAGKHNPAYLAVTGLTPGTRYEFRAWIKGGSTGGGLNGWFSTYTYDATTDSYPKDETNSYYKIEDGKLVAGANASAYMMQAVSVTAGKTYVLTATVAGGLTGAGVYIAESTGESLSQWTDNLNNSTYSIVDTDDSNRAQTESIEFTATTDVVVVGFRNPSATWATFDDVSLKPRTDIKKVGTQIHSKYDALRFKFAMNVSGVTADKTTHKRGELTNAWTYIDGDHRKVIDFGVVLHVKEDPSGDALDADTSNPSSNKIPAKKLTSFDETSVVFVARLDVPQDMRERRVSARAYVQYIDENGQSKYYYSETIVESIASIEDRLEQDSPDDSLEDGVFYESDDGSNRIYEADNGVVVWDVNIDAGIGEEVYIAHLSDLHFNAYNETDIEENDPVLMSTIENRTYMNGGITKNQARNCLALTGDADAHVFNGDTVDFLSDGAMQLMKEEIWDKYPDCIATVGGHEIARQMQGTVAETLTREQRLEMVQGYWQHDIYYESKVIKDKVMIIGFMNDCGLQTAEQTTKLKADLQLARENGYVVLLFAHEPITTNNPAHAAFPQSGDVLFEGNGGSRVLNYYNGDLPGGTSADAVSREFYDVIYNSADVIKGFFAGHWHDDYKMDILAKTPDGEAAIIPQYVHANSYHSSGHFMRILVK